MNKLVTEFIGTLFLVFTIGCSAVGPSPLIASPFAPFAIAAVLMVMIYAGGHISGAHYNPAVTLGVTIRGRCSQSDAIGYMVAQVLGAIVAALLVGWLKPGLLGASGALAMQRALALPTAPLDVERALIAEMLFTFALVYVVLNVATSKATANNQFYGAAIAGTVLAGAFSVGRISGGVFNPAVAVGALIMGSVSLANLWVYLVANFAGAIGAALVFKKLNPGD